MKGMAPSQKPGQEDWLPGKGLPVIRHFVEPFHAKYAEPHLLQPVLKPGKAKCAQGINPAHICRRERTDTNIPGPAGRPGLGRTRAIYREAVENIFAPHSHSMHPGPKWTAKSCETYNCHPQISVLLSFAVILFSFTVISHT